MGVPKFYRWLSERYPLINPKIEDSAAEMPEFGASQNPCASSSFGFAVTVAKEHYLTPPSLDTIKRCCWPGCFLWRTPGADDMLPRTWPGPAPWTPAPPPPLLCASRWPSQYFSAHERTRRAARHARLDAGTCKVHSKDTLTPVSCPSPARTHAAAPPPPTCVFSPLTLRPVHPTRLPPLRSPSLFH
jgi:hypothetical protein